MCIDSKRVAGSATQPTSNSAAQPLSHSALRSLGQPLSKEAPEFEVLSSSKAGAWGTGFYKNAAAGAPTTMRLVLCFERAVDLEGWRQAVATRLLAPKRHSRFRSQMVEGVGGIYFEELPVSAIDLTYHITEAKAQGWTMAAMNEHMYQEGSEILPLNEQGRPLWKMQIFNNLRGNQHAVVMWVSHAMCDMVGLQEALCSLYDQDPSTCKPIATGSSVPKLSNLRRLGCFLYGLALAFLGPLVQQDTMTLLKMERKQEEKTPVDRCSYVVKIPMKQMNLVKNKLGATINDVLGGTLAISVQRFLEEKKDPALKRNPTLHFGFPFNLRDNNSSAEQQICNVFGMDVAPVRANYATGAAAVQDYRTQMQLIKLSPASRIGVWLLRALASILSPGALLTCVTPIFGGLTLMWSNVPGPTTQVSVTENMVKEIFWGSSPFLQLGVHVTSYNSSINVWFVTGKKAVSSLTPSAVAQHFETEFQTLLKDLGL